MGLWNPLRSLLMQLLVIFFYFFLLSCSFNKLWFIYRKVIENWSVFVNLKEFILYFMKYLQLTKFILLTSPQASLLQMGFSSILHQCTLNFSFALKLLGPVTLQFKFNQTEKSQKLWSQVTTLTFVFFLLKAWREEISPFCVVNIWFSKHLCTVFILNPGWPRLISPQSVGKPALSFAATIGNHF